MPRVTPGLKDVSTEFQLIDPGTYELLIKGKPDLKKSGTPGSPTSPYREVVVIHWRVDQPGDFQGRGSDHQIHLHKKDGEPNEVGMIELKRWYEAAFGPDEVATWDDEDYDTDKLENQRVLGEVHTDQFEEKKKLPGGGYSDEPVLDPTTGEPKQRKSNKVKNVVPIG